MSDSESGWDPCRPVKVEVGFSVLAKDEETLEYWQKVFAEALDRMLELMHDNFPGVEIFHEVVLPTTEVLERGEV